MSGLFLPIERFSSSHVRDVAPGRLIAMPPRSQQPTAPSIGIRFNAGNALMALALTPFMGGRLPAGDAVDLSTENTRVLVLDAQLVIEGAIDAPAIRADGEAVAPGALVLTGDGAAIAAYFSRHNPQHFQCIRPVLIGNWAPAFNESVLFSFGGGRLRLDIEDMEPIYWTPNFENVHNLGRNN